MTGGQFPLCPQCGGYDAKVRYRKDSDMLRCKCPRCRYTWVSVTFEVALAELAKHDRERKNVASSESVKYVFHGGNVGSA